MPCPFCHCSETTATVYPVNRFNNREFRYVRCKDCKLIYLDTFPAEADYILMYPPSYQENRADTTILSDPYAKLPGLRFSYGYQFDLVKAQVGPGASILDYGCGAGNFIVNAIHHGFRCTGAEFNPAFVSVLQSAITDARFYTIGELLKMEPVRQFDVIRLSNVLEHLTAPAEVLAKLSNFLRPGGIFLIEGPIEENFCLAKAARSFYFGIKKLLWPRRVISSPPYHIFLSDRKNQRSFFTKCGLAELHFNISEDPWPFPASLREAKGMMKKTMAVMGRASILFSRAFSKHLGNIFIYTGKII